MSFYKGISVAKFLRIFYNISGSKYKNLTHTDLQCLIGDLRVIDMEENPNFYELCLIGVCVMVKDCENNFVCYKSPECIDLKVRSSDFEETPEFKGLPLYYRFTDYEGVSVDSYYEEEVFPLPKLSKVEISQMDKWELLELKKKLKKYKKMSIETYCLLNSLLKNELSKRRKETIQEKLIQQQFSGKRKTLTAVFIIL